MFGNLLHDCRLAARSWRRSPLFVIAAVGSLALGLGANTAIFSFVDRLLLRPLPVADPDSLVRLGVKGSRWGRVMGEDTFSYPMFRDLRAKNEVLAGLAARFEASAALTDDGASERIQVELVSGNFFDVVGVPMALGRGFTDEDDATPGAHPVVVLSHGFWQRRFAADPTILDRTLVVNRIPMTVLGVTAREFPGIEAGSSPDLYVPMMMKAAITPTWNGLDNRREQWLLLVGRLRPGITREQASVSLTTLWRPILEEEWSAMPGTPPAREREAFVSSLIPVEPAGTGLPGVRRELTTPLLVLMSLAGVVVLIACANVAGLLLARAANRRREIVIRTALGSSRLALIRQMMAESLLLVMAGGAAGVLAAFWIWEGLIRYLGSTIEVANVSPEFDWRILGFHFALCAATVMLFGLGPALTASRAGAERFPHIRSRKGLIVGQVALSLVLLFGAGLFARSLANLRDVDLGFRTERVLALTVDASLSGYDQTRIASLYSELLSRFSALPGIERATFSEQRVLNGDAWFMSIRVEGYQAKEGDITNAQANRVGPGFFQALGYTLMEGRDLTARDIGEAPKVAVVNEEFARRYFDGASPLGRRFARGRGEPDIEIVGVVRNSKHTSFRDEVGPFFYLPLLQGDEIGEATFYIRTALDAAQAAAILRRELEEVDRAIPITHVRTMEAQLDRSLARERALAALCTSFGILASALAAVGIYGLLAFLVARRKREIGVRMAVGATSGDVLRMMLREAVILVGAGVVIGVPVALGLGRFVQSQLFGLSPYDAVTAVGSTLLLAALALAATAFPARQAARIDPASALRYE